MEWGWCGWSTTQGQWVSRACECQEMEREERRLAAAHIPERYRLFAGRL
jgi:hypothetical protein